MIDFVGFGRGFQQRGDYNQGKRREMAEAFARFKADNPYATQADFQSFIDQYSGGRNYIAGGAPSSEILASLAENNLRAKQLNEANQSLDMFNKQNDAKKKVTELIDQSLLALPEENGTVDFTKGALEFQKQYGDLFNSDNPLMKGFNLSDRFNQSRRNLLVSKQIQEFLPQAKTLIQSSNGKISDDALRLMGIPANLVAEVKSQTEKAYKQDQENLQATRKMTLLEQATSMIDRGMPNIIDNLKGIASAYGMEVNSPEATKYFKDIEKQALEVESNKKTDRANMLNDRSAELFDALNNSFMKNPSIINLVRMGEIDKAKETMRAMIAMRQPDLQPYQIERLQQFVDNVKSLGQMQQGDFLGKQRLLGNQASLKATSQYKDDNIAKAVQYFGKSDKPNKPSGQLGGYASMAASTLAGQFDMNPTNLDLLNRVFMEAPEGSLVSDLISIGADALNNVGAQTFSNQAKIKGDQARLATGGFGKPTTVKEWNKETESTIDKHFDNTANAFTKILAMPQTNKDEIQRKINRLVGLNNAVMQGVGLISSNIKWAEDNSFGQDTWITYGTDRLTNEGAVLSNSMKMKLKEIQDVIKEEQDKLNQLSPSAPNNKIPGNNQLQGSGPNAFLRFFDSVKKKSELKDQLFENLASKNIEDTEGYDTGINVFSPNTSLMYQAYTGASKLLGSFSDDELENNKLVYKFLKTRGNLDDILKNKNKYAEFNADPVAYVKSKINMGN